MLEITINLGGDSRRQEKLSTHTMIPRYKQTVSA